MKQITAKTVEQALIWIDSHAHHIVQIYPPAWEGEKGIELVGHGEKLRVPNAIRKAVFNKIEVNKRPFDTRMYRVTKHGREWLKAQMHKAAVGEGLTIFEQMVRDGELKIEEGQGLHLAVDNG